jgi:hypothetical protein
MKKIVYLIMFTLVLNSVSFAQKIVIANHPKNINEFVTLRNAIATSPEGGAAMFLLALKIYADNPKLGEKCLVVSIHKSLLVEGKTYKGYKLKDEDMDIIKRNIENNKLIPNSYIIGANPENGYTVKLPYEYDLSVNLIGKSQAGTKVMAKSSGAGNKRSIVVKKNNRGYWKATIWASILADIKPPVEDDDL